MKKFFAIIMSILMIACFMPTMAFAESVESCESGADCITHEAAIGTTHYDTLAEAIGAVKDGETITLLKDATIDSKAYNSKNRLKVSANNVTIDLNDKVLTVPNYTLSLSGDNITLKRGKVLASEKGSYAIVANGKDVTIDGVTIGGLETIGGISVSGYNGNDVKSDVSATIKNCNITATNYYAVCAQGEATAVIENSTLTCESGYDFFWIEKAFTDEYGSVGNSKLTYDAETVTLKGSKPLYNTVGVAPVVTGLNIGDNQTIEAVAVSTEAHLKAAIEAGKNVMLASDITADVTVPEGKTVILYLNGKKLTNKSDHTITNAGTLTIAGTGTVDNITNGRAALYNKGTATLNGGTFTRSAETGADKTTGGGNSWYTIKNVGTMAINGNVNVTNAGHFSSMIINGDTEDSKSTLVINGGNFSGGINTVKNGENGVLKISGGDFSNTTQYVVMNWNDATINGGNFVANSTAEAVLFTSKYEGSTAGTLKINNGTFTANEGQSLVKAYYDANHVGSATIAAGKFNGNIKCGEYGTLAITGGTFSVDPAAFTPNVACYTVAKDENTNKWTVTANHTWNDGKVTEEATYDKSGTKEYTCTVDGCNATKTEEIPKLVRRSSGSASSSTSTTTTGTVTNATEDKKTDTSTSTGTTTVATTTATVKTETKTATDGTKTVAATVDNTTATKIVEKAVENKSEEVVIDTATASSTGAATVTETAAGTTTKVDLPEQTVKAIAEKTEAAVTIKSDAAEVKLDTEAVKAVAEQAGETGTVNLVVETVAQNETKVEVDLKLVTSKGNVSDFKGGNVTVTVKLNTKLAAKPVVCVYIDDNGTYHKVKGVKNADGTFTFETGHFSTYAVMEEAEADKVIAEQTANVDKLVSALTLKARSVKTAKGNIKITLTADNEAIKAIEDLGYTVKYKFYRSTKKARGYKAAVEKAGKTYTNTTGKKGTKYYYKARVMVYDAQGELIAKSALSQCKYASRTR